MDPYTRTGPRADGAPGYDEQRAHRPDALREQYHGDEDEARPLAFFHGLMNAICITLIVVAVSAILWLMLSQAFASGTSPECEARGYRGAECTAYHQEPR